MGKAGRPKGTEKNGLKYLNESQLDQFFKVVDRSKNKRDMFMFRLILFLGLRVSEASQIRMKDLNLEDNKIYIWALKNGRSTEYFLDGKLMRRLSIYLRMKNKMDGKNPYLFANFKYWSSEPISSQQIKYAFKKYACQAGLSKNFSIHSLRHSCGVIHAKRGESPIAIMLWLRHRSVQSTQIYFEQLQDEEMNDRAKESFSAFL